MGDIKIMKKTITIAVFAIIALFLFCSCAEKAPAASETPAITYTDIYEANTYSAVTSNHSSILLKDSELVDGEYIECEYYWTEAGFAMNTFPYTDDAGNTIRDVRYIADEGLYLYFSPMTAETAAFDMLEYYADGSYTTEESVSIFGLVPPEYDQTITECKKTDNGYEVTGENSDMSYIPMFYAAFFTDGECAEGDKIQFKMVLNEEYEMLECENYYVFADGSKTVKTNYCEFVYDSSDCPDYMTSVNAALEKGAKDISVSIYTENEVLERKVYSDIFLLYTDLEVYSDAEYTDLLPDDAGYYMFDTSNDIAVYLKAPAAEE